MVESKLRDVSTDFAVKVIKMCDGVALLDKINLIFYKKHDIIILRRPVRLYFTCVVLKSSYLKFERNLQKCKS